MALIKRYCRVNTVRGCFRFFRTIFKNLNVNHCYDIFKTNIDMANLDYHTTLDCTISFKSLH